MSMSFIRPDSVESAARPIEVVDVAGRDEVITDLVGRLRDPRCTTVERRRLGDAAVRLGLPLAYRLARGFQQRGEMLEDLRQVAAYALVKAIGGYDPDRGHRFTAYATPTITGEIKRHFRDRVWSVHMPRPQRDLALQVTRTRAQLTQRLGRYPSAAEVAAELGVAREQVDATAASFSAYRADSLNQPCGEGDGLQRQDPLGTVDPALESADDRLTVRALVQQLPPRQKWVVDRYFFGGWSQAQIAAAMGTSQMTVCRLLSSGLDGLRRDLCGPGRASGGDVRVRTYAVERDCVVAGVVGTVDRPNMAELRRCLVDAVVGVGARTLVIDLRRMSSADGGVARALLDAYRAGGHSGTRICVVNAAPPVADMLRRTGLSRLFPCRARTDVRPATPGHEAGERSAPARPTPARVTDDPGAGAEHAKHAKDPHRRPFPVSDVRSPAQRAGAVRWWISSRPTRRSPRGTPAVRSTTPQAALSASTTPTCRRPPARCRSASQYRRPPPPPRTCSTTARSPTRSSVAPCGRTGQQERPAARHVGRRLTVTTK